MAAFDSVTKIATSASKEVAAVFAAGFDKDLDFGQSIFEGQLRQSNDRADKALENATKLNEGQIELMQARAEAISRGDAKIKIIGEGLSPILRELLRTLMEEIQVQANQEGLELLI